MRYDYSSDFEESSRSKKHDDDPRSGDKTNPPTQSSDSKNGKITRPIDLSHQYRGNKICVLLDVYFLQILRMNYAVIVPHSVGLAFGAKPLPKLMLASHQ